MGKQSAQRRALAPRTGKPGGAFVTRWPEVTCALGSGTHHLSAALPLALTLTLALTSNVKALAGRKQMLAPIIASRCSWLTAVSLFCLDRNSASVASCGKGARG
jgi:hypothetical protein